MLNPVRRKVVSQLLFLSFLVMGITGLLSFVTTFSKPVSGLHSFFGFAFLGLALIHLSFNLKSLKQYFLTGKGKLNLIGKIIIWIALIIAGINHRTPFSQLLELSNNLKNRKLIVWKETDEFLAYDYRMERGNTSLQIEIKKGKHFWYPQMAIWLEDTTQKWPFVTNLCIFN